MIKFRPSLNSLAWIFVALSLVNIFGREIHNWDIADLGRVMAFSPAPRPFVREGRGGRNTGRNFIFGCESPNGNIQWQPVTNEIRGRLPGPQRRIINFLRPIRDLRDFYVNKDGQFPLELLPSQIEIFKYSWCKDGPLAQAASCPADTIAIHVSYEKGRGNILATRKFRCET